MYPAGSSGQIVVAGAGYAGLHVALRLAAKLRNSTEPIWWARPGTL